MHFVLLKLPGISLQKQYAYTIISSFRMILHLTVVSGTNLQQQ